MIPRMITRMANPLCSMITTSTDSIHRYPGTSHIFSTFCLLTHKFCILPIKLASVFAHLTFQTRIESIDQITPSYETADF
jgi:hypothetical protein